jgi:hypothetical protein
MLLGAARSLISSNPVLDSLRIVDDTSLGLRDPKGDCFGILLLPGYPARRGLAAPTFPFKLRDQDLGE